MASSLRFALTPLIAAALVLPASVQAAETLRFFPGKLTFEGKALGETGESTAVLKNTTAKDIAILSADLDSGLGYTFTTTCGSVLKAGSRCAYTVRYEPKSLAPAAALLTVATSDPGFPAVTLKIKGNLYPMLNDTGITGCVGPDGHGLPCPAKDFPRQDAEYGRDAAANNDADGHAGFSFTKLDSNGEPLPADASEWDCVRDNVTGLIWEIKAKGDGVPGNQGLHDADDTYGWLSTDYRSNGGYEGDIGKTATCSGYSKHEARTYCNTEAYLNRVNAAGWCGFKDWRMPGIDELMGLADLSAGLASPLIDQGYFPDFLPVKTLLSQWKYWSSSPDVEEPEYAWAVDFYAGESSFRYRDDRYAVRLVRGGR